MKKIWIVFGITIGSIIAIFLWWNHGISSVNPGNKTPQEFVIRKGEGLRGIASALQGQGLINDQLVFFALVKQLGLDGKIQAGDYKLSQAMTPEEIAKTLTKGSEDVWITIAEGKRATQIAELLQNNLTTYDPSWKTQLVANEGYLFPDTYLFPHDATIDEVLTIFKTNFDAKFVQASQNPTTKFSESDAVILASILEREGRSPDDMKMIASVLENRLAIGMALQADSTIQYVLGGPANWWPTPTAQNLKINSPYNTYLNPGLPPTPIANPGLDALTAVYHPASTNYLYYISDGNGKLHFARTLDEQNANIQKFGL